MDNSTRFFKDPWTRLFYGPSKTTIPNHNALIFEVSKFYEMAAWRIIIFKNQAMRISYRFVFQVYVVLISHVGWPVYINT